MHSQQLVLNKGNWETYGDDLLAPQLILAMGEYGKITERKNFDFLREKYPNANLVTASTSADIRKSQVLENSIVATALKFDSTPIKFSLKNIGEAESAFELGKGLFKELEAEDLVHILVISDGILVNGSELVGGLDYYNDKKIIITGGLAGDGAKFEHTCVGLNTYPEDGNVVAIGFYGKHIKIGHGCQGGWDPFGPERVITKSDRNILYQLDNQSALSLYKKYLGPLSDELPGSALLFPLNLKSNEQEEGIVRTILAVDENQQSMTFAGNMPQGGRVQLMKAGFEKLVDGAAGAATESIESFLLDKPDFALLISCVGRKLVMNQRIDDEVEVVQVILGNDVCLAGFYSNGEISPLVSNRKCELHNQSMTITTYKEI